jgi:hypothetical protein
MAKGKTAKSEMNSADIDFAKEIWDATNNILRGSMDVSEYQHVILGLIFFREEVVTSGGRSVPSLPSLK